MWVACRGGMMEGTHCLARGQCILDRMSPWSDNPRRLIDAYAVGQGGKRILSNAPDIVIVVRKRRVSRKPLRRWQPRRTMWYPWPPPSQTVVVLTS